MMIAIKEAQRPASSSSPQVLFRIKHTAKNERVPSRNEEEDVRLGGSNVENAVAGMAAPIQALRELLLWPVMYATEAASLGLRWPKGLLMYGPPGTGKTSVGHAAVRECNAHFTSLSGASVHKAYAGGSEKVLREAFHAAASEAATGKPAIICIDEIYTMSPPRDSS